MGTIIAEATIKWRKAFFEAFATIIHLSNYPKTIAAKATKAIKEDYCAIRAAFNSELLATV